MVNLDASNALAADLVVAGNQLKSGLTSPGTPTSVLLSIAFLIMPIKPTAVELSTLVPYEPPKTCDSVFPVVGVTPIPSIHFKATSCKCAYAATVFAR